MAAASTFSSSSTSAPRDQPKLGTRRVRFVAVPRYHRHDDANGTTPSHQGGRDGGVPGLLGADREAARPRRGIGRPSTSTSNIGRRRSYGEALDRDLPEADKKPEDEKPTGEIEAKAARPPAGMRSR